MSTPKSVEERSEGFAVDCMSDLLAVQAEQIKKLESAIRKHRDQRGDDRCWLDDRELYAVLPEGYAPPVEDSCVELKRCEKFIACRHDPATTYVSPQRMIEKLTDQCNQLERVLRTLTGPIR